MLLQTKRYLQNTQNFLIKTVKDGKAGEYEKDFMKIKFNSDDNLALNKTLNTAINIISDSNLDEKSGYL